MTNLNLVNTNWYYCPGSIDKERDYEPKEYSFDNLNNIQQGISTGEVPNIEGDALKRFNLACDYIAKRVIELENTFPNSNAYIQTDIDSDLNECFVNPNVNLSANVHIAIILRSKIDDKVLHIEAIQYSDRNLYISVNDNPMLIGCLKALTMIHWVNELTSLRATIIQPGIDSDPIRHQNLTTWSLKSLVEKLFNAANKVSDFNPPLHSGNHCYWCLHKPNCSEIIETKKEEINKMDNGELSIIQSVHTDLKTMDASKIADILDAETSFKDAFERARAEAKLRVEAGQIIANNTHQYIMGTGKKVKAWNEPEANIVKKLKGMKVIKDDIYPSKLITPSAALKLANMSAIQLNNLKKLISEVDGKTTLIKTERVAMSSEQSFADVATKQIEHSEEVPNMSFL